MKRGWLTGWVLGIVLVVFSPAWANADKEHPENAQPEKKDTDHKADPHEKEKPDFFKGFFDLAIWTIVVFLLLLFVLGKFAWPMMLEGLEKREKAVASALEKAQYAQAEAERIKAELDLKFKQAHDEIRSLLEESRKRAQQTADDMTSKAQAEIQAAKERLNREIETRADQALQDLMTKVSNLATTISTKVIRRQLSEEDHHRLIDEALSEMQQAAQERQRVLAGLS